MLHLTCHHDFVDALFLADLDQAAELAERNPIASRCESFDLGRGFFADADRDHLVPQLASRFQGQQRKAAVPRDQSITAHFTNPRSDPAMNLSSSSISAVCSTSARIFSTACVVFNPDLISKRNVL